MTERESHHDHRLHLQLMDVISEIEGETGRKIDIQASRAIRDRARAVYVVSDPDPTRHLIIYDPRFERHLNHLVAHECGHIVRFASATPKDQTLAKTTAASRARAAQQLLPNLRHLVDSGLPEGALSDLLEAGHFEAFLALIENLPFYLAVENLDYLQSLDTIDLFGDDAVGR